MLKIDFSDLLGKGFEYGGRGPDTYDCYGLAREVSRRAGIELPEWESVCERIAIHGEIEKGKELFRQIPKPKPFCLATISILQPYTSHIGIVLGDCRRFLHILEKSSVTMERLDSTDWRGRVTGFWELKR